MITINLESRLKTLSHLQAISNSNNDTFIIKEEYHVSSTNAAAALILQSNNINLPATQDNQMRVDTSSQVGGQMNTIDNKNEVGCSKYFFKFDFFVKHKTNKR